MKKKKFLTRGDFIAILILLTAIFAGNQINKKRVDEKSVTEISMESLLPIGWQIEEEIDDKVVFKVKKSVGTGVGPIVVLIKDQKENTPENYLDQLIAGAKSTIPGLKYTKNNKEKQDGFQITELEGFYYNSNKKINLIQQVYQKDNQLFLITASWSEDSEEKEILRKEIEQILKLIFKTKISF